MPAFKPCGVITVTTDFGHKGPFVAVMKGVILTRHPTARIVDLTHEIPAHWPAEAGFWLSRSYRYFPAGTVHVAIVDPGAGTERDILLAVVDGQAFMAPDNGLLAPLLTRFDRPAVYALDPARLGHLRLPVASPTFHGRDIYAPIAAELAAGRVAPADAGSSVDNYTPGWIDDPEISHNRISGVIVTVDAFGNLISNIEEPMLSGLHKPEVRLGGHSFELKTAYGRVNPGDYLALINSFGVLEIARAQGNAAEGLGTERGAPVIVTAR